MNEYRMEWAIGSDKPGTTSSEEVDSDDSPECLPASTSRQVKNNRNPVRVCLLRKKKLLF